MQKTFTLSRFDATLKTVTSLETSIFDDWKGKRPNASLTLTLRLGFNQINPAGGANTGTYPDYGRAGKPERDIIKWTDESWKTWKSDFIKSAQKFWDNKFCLVNQWGYFPYKLDGKILLPNVKCRVKLVAQDSTATDNHHSIDVVRLAASENWFGSHSRLYDSKDINSVPKGKDSAGNPIMQRAHVHEVGHIMGLGHVDIGKAHCPASGDTNDPLCYGVADEDKKSVMGQGMELRKTHAQPWLTAIKKFETWSTGHPSFTELNKQVRAAGVSATPYLPWTAEFWHYQARTMDEVKARALHFGLLEPA